MEISGSFGISGLQAARATHKGSATNSSATVADVGIATPQDQLDLSPEAQALNFSTAAPASDEIRTEKVASIRRAIADGSYETPEKLSGALDRLLDQLG